MNTPELVNAVVDKAAEASAAVLHASTLLYEVGAMETGMVLTDKGRENLLWALSNLRACDSYIRNLRFGLAATQQQFTNS